MQCKWNYLDKTICSNDRDPNSRVWCTPHKEKADKVWEIRDPRTVAYEESKKPKIVDVQLPDLPGESYL